MTRTRSSVALVMLLPFMSSCGADSTGPDDNEVISDRIVVSIRTIGVIHDCDPAPDNPGDFQAWVEIWQGTAGGGVSERVAASAKKTILIHSGEVRNTASEVRVEGLVARVPGREVSVYALVRELDNDDVDAYGDQVEKLSWSVERDCWTWGTACMPTINAGYQQLWTTRVRKRADIFNPFNPDDEGCAFDVTYAANITRTPKDSPRLAVGPDVD